MGAPVEHLVHYTYYGALHSLLTMVLYTHYAPVKHLAHEDIVLGLVGIEQRDLSRVRRVVQDRSRHLRGVASAVSTRP